MRQVQQLLVIHQTIIDRKQIKWTLNYHNRYSRRKSSYFKEHLHLCQQ